VHRPTQGLNKMDNNNRVQPQKSRELKNEIVEAALYLVSHGSLAGFTPFGYIQFLIKLKSPVTRDAKIDLIIESSAAPHPCLFGSAVNSDCYDSLWFCPPYLQRLSGVALYPPFSYFVNLPPVPFTAGSPISVTIPAGKDEIYLFLQPKEFLSPSGILSRKARSPRLKISLVESQSVILYEDPLLDLSKELQPYIVQFSQWSTPSFYLYNAIADPDITLDNASYSYPLTDDADYNTFVANPTGDKYQKWNFTDTQIMPTVSLYEITDVAQVNRFPDTYRRIYPNQYTDYSQNPPVTVTTPIDIDPSFTVNQYGAFWDSFWDTMRTGGCVSSVTDWITRSDRSFNSLPFPENSYWWVRWAEIWTDINPATLYSPARAAVVPHTNIQMYFNNGINNGTTQQWGLDGIYYPNGTGLETNRHYISQDDNRLANLPPELQINGWWRSRVADKRVFSDNEQNYYDWNALYPDYRNNTSLILVQSFGEQLVDSAIYVATAVQLLPDRSSDFDYFRGYYGL
jgi:hypothetical protein